MTGKNAWVPDHGEFTDFAVWGSDLHMVGPALPRGDQGLDTLSTGRSISQLVIWRFEDSEKSVQFCVWFCMDFCEVCTGRDKEWVRLHFVGGLCIFASVPVSTF